MYGRSTAAASLSRGTGYAGDDTADKQSRKAGKQEARAKEAQSRAAQYQLVSSYVTSGPSSIVPTEELLIVLRQTLRNFGVNDKGESVTWNNQMMTATLKATENTMRYHPSHLGDIHGKDDCLVLALQDAVKTAQLKVQHPDGSSKNELKTASEILRIFPGVKKASLQAHETPDIMVTDSKDNYRQALRPHAFSFCDSLPHHVYLPKNVVYGSTSSMPAARRKRLFQELSGYQTNLPIEHGSSIFVRAMESQIDHIRVLIIGPEDTPYANGCFLFDLVLTNYPQQAPKCQFLTTGGGKYRLNPNLYSNGKVCLSLLGTWKGPSWVPNESTLYQLLISIQSLILGEPEPYFNEPGYEASRTTNHGRQASVNYNKNIREYTCAAAILPFLNATKDHHPYPEFQEAIDLHFRLKQDAIVRQLQSWKQDCVAQPSRSSLNPRGMQPALAAVPGTKSHVEKCLEIMWARTFIDDGEVQLVDGSTTNSAARLPSTSSNKKKRLRNHVSSSNSGTPEVIALDDDRDDNTKLPPRSAASLPALEEEVLADEKIPAKKKAAVEVISLDDDSDVEDEFSAKPPTHQNSVGKSNKTSSAPEVISLDDD